MVRSGYKTEVYANTPPHVSAKSEIPRRHFKEEAFSLMDSSKAPFAVF